MTIFRESKGWDYESAIFLITGGSCRKWPLNILLVPIWTKKERPMLSDVLLHFTQEGTFFSLCYSSCRLSLHVYTHKYVLQ